MYKEMALGKNRVEALTDGIYAIAMTLGVLTIDVSELPAIPEGGHLINHLSVISPHIIHYAIAFFVLISFWMAHHRQMNHMRDVDAIYTWLSLVTLFFVAIVPFTTDLVGSYSEYPMAVTLYAGNLLMIGLLSSASWYYATAGRRLVTDSISKDRIQLFKARGLSAPVVAIIVILYANFISASYSTILFLLIPLMKKMMIRIYR